MSDADTTGERDVIVVKSVLGSVRAVHGEDGLGSAGGNLRDMLVDGGAIWFAENLEASVVHRQLRERFVSWSERWHYFTLDELTAVLSVGFVGADVSTTGCLAAFGRTESQRGLLAAIDARLGSAVPTTARYVGYGVATRRG